jgi:pimeloyl-ACP methyl ester carboxylesterase
VPPYRSLKSEKPMPYCTVGDQVDLYYEDFGDGPPIVFTNAGNLTHKMWMGQVAALAPAFRTITYDIRGTGCSSKPRSGYTAETAAADLCALIDRLHLGVVTLAAHGIGTHIAMIAAELRPDLTKGLILVSGGPWFHGKRDGLEGGVADEFLAFLSARAERGVPYAEICEEMIDTWLFHKPPKAGVVHSLVEQALAWPQFVLGAFSRSMRGIDHRQRLPGIACPTLIMHGRYDRKQLYEGAAYMARLMNNARLVTLERSAHMAQLEEPEIFNQVSSSFLRDLNTRDRPA